MIDCQVRLVAIVKDKLSPVEKDVLMEFNLVSAISLFIIQLLCY